MELSRIPENTVPLSNQTTFTPPIDIHGMGNGEDGLSSVDAHTATKIFTKETNGRQVSSPSASCFDLFAGLWVFMYERSVPHAQKEVEQNCLLDELYASTQRLKTRRDEIQSRVRQQILEAKRIQARKDPRSFKNRMVGIRRLRSQVDRIDTSIMAIENNVDEIVNTDVTKDIVESLKRSTQAIKNKGFNIGGVEGVQDTMEELQNELQMCQEVTDTIYKGFNNAVGELGSGYRDDITEEDLVDELNMLLREEGEEEIQKQLEVPYHHPYLSHENRPLSHILTEDSVIGDHGAEETSIDVEITSEFTHRNAVQTEILPSASSAGLVSRHGPVGTTTKRYSVAE